LRVKKYSPSHVPSIADVKTELTALTKQAMAAEKAKILAGKIQADLAKGDKPNKLAASNKLIWNKESSITHSDTSVPATILDAAFYTAFDKKDASKNNHVVSLKNGDYAVLDITSVTKADPSAMSASDRSMLAKALSQFQGKMSYQLFTKSTVNSAKVEIDQKALKATG
jgi:hypothetical protein